MKTLEASFVVRSYEIDGRNRALLRTITGYLQEAAVRQALELGVARGQMAPNLTWMLSEEGGGIHALRRESDRKELARARIRWNGSPV